MGGRARGEEGKREERERERAREPERDRERERSSQSLCSLKFEIHCLEIQGCHFKITGKGLVCLGRPGLPLSVHSERYRSLLQYVASHSILQVGIYVPRLAPPPSGAGLGCNIIRYTISDRLPHGYPSVLTTYLMLRSLCSETAWDILAH